MPVAACAALDSHIGAPISLEMASAISFVLGLVDRDDLAEQGEALFARGAREGLERLAGGGDRLVDIGLGAERDAREGFFVGRVDDVDRLGRDGVHPFAVDVELKTFLHFP